ncbi:MAG: GNAT family N-acetyltransferase [Acidobacteria bacterium]|nr:GNAT family N-acetyltransferase [Acidobacteriota bacterium]MCB9398515.1 GNAT family N-acetyltransferase [Acidobacteriota bacterium]
MQVDYTVHKAQTAQDRTQILSVLATVYQEEKGWIPDLEPLFPLADLHGNQCAWFIVQLADQAVGAVRVLYELPLALYRTYKLEPIDPQFDLANFVVSNPVAEIGRFAVLAEHRNKFVAAALLMKAAVADTLDRGYTHYITDVFENEPTSPLQFHTRVLGFEPVATHQIGEFKCSNRRITLVLDLQKSLRRLSSKGSWIFRFICGDWSSDRLHRYLNPVPAMNRIA